MDVHLKSQWYVRDDSGVTHRRLTNTLYDGDFPKTALLAPYTLAFAVEVYHGEDQGGGDFLAWLISYVTDEYLDPDEGDNATAVISKGGAQEMREVFQAILDHQGDHEEDDDLDDCERCGELMPESSETYDVVSEEDRIKIFLAAVDAILDSLDFPGAPPSSLTAWATY